MSVTVLKSAIDDTVNFITSTDDGGMLEARYVHRPNKDYITCYISTQTGCGQGCKFCHLTATKQTQARDAIPQEIEYQALQVLGHHDEKAKARADGTGHQDYEPNTVHFSFMARGEPLASDVFWQNGDWIMQELAREAVLRGLMPKFMVSTIMPKGTLKRLQPYGVRLAQAFRVTQPLFYYSLYSLDKEFRKKWLPGAVEPEIAFELLKDYQDDTGRIIKLHWALIAGENDSLDNTLAIVDAVDKWRLLVNVNLVRYNPFSAELGKEASDDSYRLTETLLRVKWPMSRVKVVDRVGFDVKGSCGCFVESEK